MLEIAIHESTHDNWSKVNYNALLANESSNGYIVCYALSYA